jgi:hypothetical protein
MKDIAFKWMNITFVKKIECFWKRAYGWAKLSSRLDKKAIEIGGPTRLGLGLDMKKKLGNEINFYINFGAKINYIPFTHSIPWCDKIGHFCPLIARFYK